MKGRNRIRAACLMTLAASGVVAFTACGTKSNEPAPSTSSVSVSPTSKATLPGANQFTPAPVTPSNPTEKPDNDGAKRP